MNAVILYEECDSARKANAFLTRASDRAGAATPWNVKPWRVDLLDLPALAREARADAAEAQILVFALGGRKELPGRLLNWLEDWAEHRQVQDAALAVFEDGSGDTLAANATPALGEFAGRHGLSFIFGDVGPAEAEWPAVWGESHDRTVGQMAVWAGVLEQVSPSHNRHWGINE